MAATTRIDFDSELLAKLRARRPGKDDRTLLEELARIELGFETLGEIQRRNALSEDEADDLALRAVREVRGVETAHLDTSVVLSAFLGASTSPPGRLLAVTRAEAFELVACPLIFDERRRGLGKPYC